MSSNFISKTREDVFSSLKGGLIVSCQADPGDPMDDIDTMSRMARSVLRGGAMGLRAEGERSVRAFRAITDLPIIGMVKTQDANGEVYITPTFATAQAISAAGANIIALDCTLRRLTEPEPWPELIRGIHEKLGKAILADVASLEDAMAAQNAGADAVATTLYGYTTETAGVREVCWPLLQEMVQALSIPVIAEGHLRQPEDVRKALDLGAYASVVGSAITRPETITNRFVAAIRS